MRRLVAALLFLFPAEFRNRFGRDMLATFEKQWQERRGWRAASRTALDLICAGLQVRCARGLSRPIQPKGDKLMTVLFQDLRFAMRTLLRSRGFTAVALLTLALGIGVNTAMFSVAHAVLWRSVPYLNPDRLVMVGEAGIKDPNSYWGAAYPNLKDWRSRSRSFEQLAIVMNVQHVLREGATPVRIQGSAVSSEFFATMGVAPLQGRYFSATEDRKGAPGVIVISRRMWMERLGGDPAVLNRSLRFGKTQYAVVGVMPTGFEYGGAEFWTPLEQEIDPDLEPRRNVWDVTGVGRMRAGVTAANATKEVEAIAAQIRQDHPESKRGLTVRVAPLQNELSRDLRPALLLLMGAVGFVLLIVCANIAGLMLVRGAARVREMAIRRALGGGYVRLIRQLLTESALLALVGGAAGIGLAFLATRALTLFTKDARLLSVEIDGPVLAFGALVTMTTTILFGIIPAISAARASAEEALRTGTRTGGTRKQARAQQSMVVAEVALCMVLLAGAGLLMRSFERVNEVDPGFRPDRLITMRIALPLSYDSDASVNRFYRQLLDRFTVLPGVSAVTLVSQLPISDGEVTGDIQIEGRDSAEGELGATTFRGAMPNYFSVMGIPLIRGRVLEARDENSPAHPVVISEGFARHFWPGGDAVGKRFRAGPRDRAPWFTIVGVVGDVRQIGLESGAQFSAYEPLASNPYSRFEVAVRATAETAGVIGSLRSALRSMDPGMLIDRTETMSERIEGSVAPRRLNLLLFELFAGLALLLAGTGLYGVVAYAASQRLREFGIRMALGARGGDVLSLVMRQGLRLAILGSALGLAATFYLGRLIAGLLFGIQPSDPATLLTVAGILILVAVPACAIPAFRATRIQPVEALRAD